MAGTISPFRPVPAGSDLPDSPVDLARRGGSAPLPRKFYWVHGATLVAAFATWAYLDRNLWFFGDEWDFLTRRGLHGAYFSLWAPHNEHWSVLPILLWRAIYSLEHLSSYWPYLVPLLLAHVAVVHLVWRRCLREGADPWVATALGLLLGLLGAGAEDLVWAFQIGFVSSLMFGFLAMEVAEGPPLPDPGHFLLPPLWPRRWAWSSRPGPGGTPTAAARVSGNGSLARDAGAAALALAALMCSTVGVASCVALAVLLLGRSGWRRALKILTVPLGAYAIWFAFAGRSGLKATGDHFGSSVFWDVPVFVATNLADDLGHASGWLQLGAFLATALVVWAVWTWRRLVKSHPAALGGVLAALVFYALAATGRDRISPTLTPSRYAYVGVAFLVPALALMVTDLRGVAERHQPAGAATGPAWARAPVFVVLLALMFLSAATVANVTAGVRFARARTAYVRGLEDQIITSAALLRTTSEMASAVDTYPIWASGLASGYLTPGVLASLYRHRLLPAAGASLMSPTEVLNDESWLDVTGLSRRAAPGLFRVISSVGLRWSVVPGSPAPGQARHYRSGAELLGVRFFVGVGNDRRVMDDRAPAAPSGWPQGPGLCSRAAPSDVGFPHSFPTSLRLRLASGASGASIWVSLGPGGGKVLASLARPWGLEGLPGDEALQGQAIVVPAGGHTWVDDRAGGYDLILQVPAGRSVELCGLAPTGGEEA